MAIYNPFEDFNPAFTKYRYLEPEVTKVEDPLFGLSNLPEGYRLSSTGNYVAPANTPESKTFDTSFIDKNAETHSEPSQEITYTTKQDLQGNKKRAMEFFQSKGLSPYHAAGIVGNLLGESKLNHQAINPTSKAFGIAQWLGDRKKKLFKKYGENPTFDQQLEFVWEELNSSEKSAFDKLLQTKSVEEATNSFMKHFERPSQREMAQSINNRIKFSRDLLV